MFEDKPVDVEKTANLLKFEITVNKHGDYSDFEDSEEVVHDFLKNVRSRFKPSGLKFIKCSFVIENIQQSEIYNKYTKKYIYNKKYTTNIQQNIYNIYTKYIQQKIYNKNIQQIYKATYFRDFVFYALRQNTLSKVIVNGMSGSS